MRRLSPAICSLALVLLVAPAMSAQETSETQTIDVQIPLTRSAAADRVVSALVAKGLTVAASDYRVIRSAPYRFNPATDATVIANLLPAGDSASRVVLSGTFDVPTLGIKNEPMTATTKRLKGQLWTWLQAIADAIEKGP